MPTETEVTLSVRLRPRNGNLVVRVGGIKFGEIEVDDDGCWAWADAARADKMEDEDNDALHDAITRALG